MCTNWTHPLEVYRYNIRVWSSCPLDSSVSVVIMTEEHRFRASVRTCFFFKAFKLTGPHRQIFFGHWVSRGKTSGAWSWSLTSSGDQECREETIDLPYVLTAWLWIAQGQLFASTHTLHPKRNAVCDCVFYRNEGFPSVSQYCSPDICRRDLHVVNVISVCLEAL